MYIIFYFFVYFTEPCKMKEFECINNFPRCKIDSNELDVDRRYYCADEGPFN